jgi:DNA-binding SARP family transcriptional activator/TolB-like protein/Flp pilus assembly protein TadD
MLHLRTFGGLSLDIDGTPGTGAAQQRKTLALLALLAASGSRGVSRDKLIASLWPETDAEHGRGLLKQACYALRRDLQARDLFLGSIQLRLNPAAISSDVASFADALEANDATQAVSCYTAPFLDGFYLNGGGEFEDWAETERARLATQYRSALEVVAAEATGRGEHRHAADAWQRVLELDPMSSRSALGLMTALDNAGDHAEALRWGQKYAELVRSELGADAPAELSEWVEQHRGMVGNGAKSKHQLPATPAEPLEVEAPTHRASAVPESFSRRLYRAQVLSLTAVAAVGVLLAGAGYAVWKQHKERGADLIAVPTRKMLAVLPFENRGPAGDDYFADGLTESISMRLGGIRNLGVIASQSSRQYKGTTKSLAQIGRELGVQYVLQGSVWWDNTSGGRRVRVSPKLLRVADGRQLWGAQYDTVLTGMFALQTSLASKVVGALDVELPGDQRRTMEPPTVNVEAYDAFLRAVDLVNTRAPGNLKESQKALHLFERAVALDSTFVVAYTWLSVAHVVMYLSYLDRDTDHLKRGKAAADRVMQLDPQCATGGCAALGFYDLFVVGNYDRALQELRRSWRARPNDFNLPSAIAHVYRRQGQWSKALAYEREAERLNPLDPGESGALGRTYALLRQFAAANYYLDRALAGTPQLANARLVKALAYLNLTGDLQGARGFLPDVSENISPTGTEDVILSLEDIVLMLGDEQQTRLLRLTPAALDGDTAALALAKALVHRRRHDAALARASFDSARVVLQEKVRRQPNENPFYHALLGLALAGLNRPDDAVREGERAVTLLPYPLGGPESTLMPANLARIHVLLGQREKAVDALTTVFSRPGPLSPAWLRVDPFWDPLRSNPRFQRLTAGS